MRPLSSGEYAVLMGWRLAILAGLALGLPLLFYVGYVLVVLCPVCLPPLMMMFVFFQPIAAGLFLFLVVGPTMARARSLDLPARLVGLTVVALAIADFRFFLDLFGLSQGRLNAVPWFLILALAIGVALALLREPADADDGVFARNGWLGRAVLAVLSVTMLLVVVLDFIVITRELILRVHIAPIATLATPWMIWLLRLEPFAASAAIVAVGLLVLFDARGSVPLPPSRGGDGDDTNGHLSGPTPPRGTRGGFGRREGGPPVAAAP